MTSTSSLTWEAPPQGRWVSLSLSSTKATGSGWKVVTTGRLGPMRTYEFARWPMTAEARISSEPAQGEPTDTGTAHVRVEADRDATFRVVAGILCLARPQFWALLTCWVAPSWLVQDRLRQRQQADLVPQITIRAGQWDDDVDKCCYASRHLAPDDPLVYRRLLE